MIRKLYFFFGAILFLTIPPVFAENVSTIGELELSLEDGQQRSAMLMNTSISGEINGLVASITIEQRFSNLSSDWVNGRYVFPLPELAAVNQFEIKVGDRLIKGLVQEKQQARASFEAAKRDGKKAGLLEQHRENLFSVNLANIAPGEEIKTRLIYIDRVRFENHQFEYSLPTTLTPRYIPDEPVFEPVVPFEQISIEIQNGWTQNAQLVDDADQISPPQTHTAQASSHQFSLDLTIDPGLATHGVFSPSHHLRQNVSSQSESSDEAIHVQLANGVEPLNQDLILQWQALDRTNTQAALFHEMIGNEHYQMLMLVPPAAQMHRLARDVTFIIDTSGSMGGASIRQARQALLQALNDVQATDRFNVVEFNNRFTSLFQASRLATAENMQLARQMVSRLDAGGGTEMRSVLGFAFSQPADESYLRQIVFITDGSVGNEDELFMLIRNHIGSARLFPIAIGSAPNTFFMRKAAKFGRGFYMRIRDVNEVQSRMAIFLEKINRPVMRNIEVVWPHDVEQYPERLPDLYANEPLLVMVKSELVGNDLRVQGELAGQAWYQELSIRPDVDNNAQNLSVLWARAKIESLTEDFTFSTDRRNEIKTKLIELGIKHNLVSRFTSFVAVEQRINRPHEESASDQTVANLMPQGATMMAPQTATSATLFQALGLMLLMLVVLFHYGQKVRWSARFVRA